MSQWKSPTFTKKCIAIIPSIEGWHLLDRLLPTIDLPKEQIFVIDQGSCDGTEQKCKEAGYGCIQMHARATFTEAVNRGIKEALDRKADYVLIINNDVEFQTHVATQLLQRAESETHLGILAPRQVTVVNHRNLHDIKRASWQLTGLNFSHEFDIDHRSSRQLAGLNPSHTFDIDLGQPELLEADFCEFTCVLINSLVFQKVGFLDEKYQFYHEDADFCFRSQEAGYRCAYDQTALIKHFVGSTFNKQKIFNREKLINRNKRYFSQDHLKTCIRFPFIPLASFIPATTVSSWSTTNEFLGSYLIKYGLATSSKEAPTLSSIAHPADVHTDYLLTVWETSQMPEAWVHESKKFKQIFVPSNWNKEVFENSGFTNVSVLPFGVETDIFNPWGAKLSFPWAKSILCVFQNQHRKGLDVTLKMWDRIRHKHPEIFLIMYGKGIEFSLLGMDNSYALRIGDFIAKIDWDRRIVLLQPAFKEYVTHMDMAMLYRSCDIYLLNSRSEGFGYPVIEAMACGTVCVIPNYGSIKEFIREKNCFSFEGKSSQADYSDKGFYNVGNWWEPDLTDLCLKVEQAISLDANTANEIGFQARQFILSNFTWRHSMVALRKKLQLLQTQPLYKSVSAKRLSPDRYRKQMASLMASVGSNLVKASIVMEHRGLPGITTKIKSRILKYCQKKFHQFEN